MRRLPVFLALLVLLPTATVFAGAYNKKLSIGDAAPAWTDLETVDGKKSALADLKGKDLVVVAFICSHCPVAQGYENRLIQFTKKYGGADGKVAVVALNANIEDEEQIVKVRAYAKEKGFNFLYAVDPSQKIGRSFGATVTPQFFVLDKERKIVYMGAFDDDIDEDQVTVRHLETAVQALLKGEKFEKTETRPRGCSIDYSGK